MKILYLTLESYKSQPILKSQVITLLSHLSNKYSVKDQKIKFFLTTRDQDIIPEINNDKLVHIPLKNDSYFINQFELLKKVSKIAAQVDVIHVRSYLPMLVALLLKLIYKKKVIFDMRGVFPEEMALRKKSRYIFSYLKNWKVFTVDMQINLLLYPKILESILKLVIQSKAIKLLLFQLSQLEH